MQARAYQVAEKLSLKDVREQLLLTQGDLKELSEQPISVRVISNCENGYSIRRMTAYKILTGLNKARVQRGLPTLTIDDLDWNVG